ncbi:MAG: bifunctional DNA-formamidopyrimidine glycosylase/DNA-(apurinic or apyrimidinic site) lyase [Gemmatimonas sp.]
MPELPEVETVRLGLMGALSGKRIARAIVNRPDLRIPFPKGFASRLQGRRVTALKRRAKYLLIRLDDGWVWVVHLGMSGRMTAAPKSSQPPADLHDHVAIETEDGIEVRFRDPRRFGLMTLVHGDELDMHPLFKGLGPEPLSKAFDGLRLAASVKGRRTSIKAALLDQRIVAGLGNIYVCEALFQSGISPKRLAGRVHGDRAVNLAAAIKAVLKKAIAAGGSSLRDHRQPSGELGYFQHSFSVYDREGHPCPGCTCDVATTGGIRRIVQGGRSTFYCPRHQR